MKAWRVRIIDSSGAKRWYRNKIGQEFWVMPFASANAMDGLWHAVVNPDGLRAYIERSDFEILREAEVRVETVTRVVEVSRG